MTFQTSSPVHAPEPGVFKWFRVYCVMLCVMYLLVAAASLIFFLGDPAQLEMSRAGALVMGSLLLVLGFIFFAASLLPLVVRWRPWVWIYGLILICLGMTSACFLPICIPLLIFWVKPEARSRFQ